ncbi:hypothetical protein FEM48_Zijuj07G0117200 [Ziziphus jujuba var. spinosa]|uniref:Zinc knuckle CX2CX4HX4C domain-containing protein n=1 Tax=Ziziphus jujuba var. spinosa TaxID=714518 RepID=A0A978V4F6_ZIZJJ|nr:hypothetical protein FEM48_Zijuj07G0117200 [Ziziphus jujuba var. spinosa]
MEDPNYGGELGIPELSLIADEQSAKKIHGLPLQYMTRDNAIIIGGLFKEVLQCDTASRTNIVGTRYMRIQVKVGVRKPLLTGFMQKIGHNKIWINFCYEHLAEFCYNCGVIGHGNAACAHPTLHNQLSDGYLYGPWIHAEADAYSVVVEGSSLRRMELPRKEIFDPLSSDSNPVEGMGGQEEALINLNGGERRASGFIGESTQWGRRSNNSKLIGFNLEVTSQSEPLIPRHVGEGDGVSVQHQSSSIQGPMAY